MHPVPPAQEPQPQELKGLQGFGVRLFQLRCCDQGRCFVLRGRGKVGEVLPKLAESCRGCWCSARKSCAWVMGGREGESVRRGAANVLGGAGEVGEWWRSVVCC